MLYLKKLTIVAICLGCLCLAACGGNQAAEDAFQANLKSGAINIDDFTGQVFQTIAMAGGQLYYVNIDDEYKLYTTKDSQKFRPISEKNAIILASIDDVLYFTDSTGLHRLQGDQLSEIALSDFEIIELQESRLGSFVYGQKLSDNSSGIYQIKDNQLHEIVAGEVTGWLVTDDGIYYAASENSNALFFQVSGQAAENLGITCFSSIYLVNGELYFLADDFSGTQQVVALKTQNNEIRTLANGIISWLDVEGDWVYYCQEGSILRKSLSGVHEDLVVPDSKSDYFDVCGKFVYVQLDSVGDQLDRTPAEVSPSGTKWQKVNYLKQ